MNQGSLSYSLIIALALYSTAINCSLAPDLVIELHRDGARGPINSTYDFENYWGDNVGELSGVGMRQQYILGMALKYDYPSLIGGDFDSN